MTLRVKLLLAQAPLAMALIVVGVVATRNVSSLGWHSEAILKDNYRSVLAAQRMKDSIEKIEHLAADVVIGLPPVTRLDSARMRQHFEDELRVQEGNPTEPGEVDATVHVRKTWTDYREHFDRFLALPDSDRTALFRHDLEPAFREVREAVETILTMNLDAIVHKSERARHVAERMNVLTFAVCLAALLIGGFVSTLLTNRLLEPLGLLTRTVHRIGEGDFETRVDISGHDEIAQLASTINQMAVRLREYRHSSLGELLVAQQASQAAIDSLPDPVVVFDLHGAILNVNQAAETLLGLGNKPLENLAPAVRAALEHARSHVLAAKGQYNFKGFEEAVPVSTPEGDRYLLPRATPVYGESGGLSGATVVLQDVTRARLVDELRDDLVATVAHEFRTPLTSLRLAIHMCLEQAAGPLTEKQADLLYTAREDCERLQKMVDELLDLARIQSGRIELHRRSTAPGELIAAALAAHRTAAKDQHLDLRIVVLPDVPDVEADAERVHLVLSNLLINAIRHTPAGGSIELRAADLGSAIRFEVADSGAGIPKEHLATVFEKFARIPGSAGGGAGLGLAIAKEIVEAHGGEIGVEDTPGGGATFWFTLPVAASNRL